MTAGAGAVRSGPATPTASAAQVIIVDTSGSMAYPPTKLANAQKATAVAIDFAARRRRRSRSSPATRWPAWSIRVRERMESATTASRAAAKAAVRQLSASGGTAMSTWLSLAERLFAAHGAEVNHAILLTDGAERRTRLAAAQGARAAARAGSSATAAASGTDWVATELRQVASALLGSADGLDSPDELPDVFRAAHRGRDGQAGRERRRCGCGRRPGPRIRFVKQVFPHIEDLTGRRTAVSDRVGDYPTGAWGAESRDYHVSIEVEPDEVGEEILAARVGLVAGGQTLVERLVLAKWTDDTALSTRISPHVAHYTGQADLAAAIQEGLAARAAGDEDVATAKLGTAVRLADESGREDTAKLLRTVVDVIDAESGTVRLKRGPDAVAAEIVDVRSTVTRRIRGD